jgi:hypothetical protein
LSSWEVFGYFWVDWLHELLWWDVFFSNRSFQLFDMQQLRGKLLLRKCGECMHSMSIWSVIIRRLELLHGEH